MSAETHSIALVRGPLDVRAAVDQFGSVAAGEAVVTRKLCVPYYWYWATGSVPRVFGRQPFALDCLVEARTGIAATADRFEIDQAEVGNAAVLPARCSEAGAAGSAYRCVTNNLTRRARSLSDFNVTLEPRGVVHKAFWLLTWGDRRLLVDSVTGGWHAVGR